jgi:hypothetical protein
MNDPLLAQSAVDRLVATSYELVIEGESPSPTTPQTQRRQRHLRLTNRGEQMNIIQRLWWSLGHGNPVVPSRWQATCTSPKKANRVVFDDSGVT